MTTTTKHGPLIYDLTLNDGTPVAVVRQTGCALLPGRWLFRTYVRLGPNGWYGPHLRKASDELTALLEDAAREAGWV